MAQVSYQELHDVMQALVMAAGRVHEVITADFPNTRAQIAAWVADGEYERDPLTALFAATERAAAVCREMERL